MSKKISVGTVIGLMAITAAVTFVVTNNAALNIFNEKVRSVSEKEEFYNKLSETDSFARTYYVNNIDESSMLDDIIRGYINGLDDPYAVYYTADEYANMSAEYTGYRIGLGFSWEKDVSGYVRVTDVTAGSSAGEYGIRPGDIIMAVNNTNIISYPGGYSEAVKLFTSQEGTKVKLHIKRISEDGTASFLNADLISSRNDIISVTGRIKGNIGYIHITEFNATTPEQFSDVLGQLKEKGAERYIFDVRDNGGGTIDSLTAVLEELLPPCEAARAFYKTTDEPLIVTVDEDYLSAPMAVLINNGTKGEAELFAYILRDEKSAVTVGKTSYGKGVLQETYKCSDGSAVKFSVASMQSKSRFNFTGIGIKPDYDVAQDAQIDPFKLSATEQELYDLQLIKAYEVIENL